MPTRRNPQQQQKLKAYARELRSLQTDAEARLWHLLRDRRFFGHKFRRQHAVENFILDFYCPEQHLAIELDGGQHGDQSAYDEKREQTLAGLGIRVLRFWNHDLLQQTEIVLQVIFDALDMPAAPHPRPLSPWNGARGGKNGVRHRLAQQNILEPPGSSARLRHLELVSCDIERA
ncbi:MAG: endonuclease domain-containing protein [Thiobacillaceae bacterium]